MTEEEFRQYLYDLAQQHNGMAGEPRAIDPEVETTVLLPSGAKAVTGTQTNPTPTYEYRFRDGTYIRVKGGDMVPGTSQAQSYTIVSGTAGAKPQEEPAPILRDTERGLGRYDIPSKSLVPVPGGEKGDPIDTAWENNLDRIEQQLRIIKASTPARPDAPAVNTSARQIPIWNEQTNQWEWKDNPNLREPTPPQGRETPDEAYRKAMALAKAKFEEKRMMQEAGYELTPKDEAELKQAMDLARDAKKQADALALAQRQSDLRRQEEEATWQRDLPFKQAAERRAQRQLALQGAQSQAGVLNKQAEFAQGILNQAVQAGTQIEGGEIVQMAFNPMAEAFNIIARSLASGEVDPSLLLGRAGQATSPASGPPLAPRGYRSSSPPTAPSGYWPKSAPAYQPTSGDPPLAPRR